jgi:hypothetical protein
VIYNGSYVLLCVKNEHTCTRLYVKLEFWVVGNMKKIGLRIGLSIGLWSLILVLIIGVISLRESGDAIRIEAKDKLKYIALSEANVFQAKVISYVKPVYVNVALVAVVGVDINFGKFTNELQNIKIYDTGSAFLLSSSYDFLYDKEYSQEENLKELNNGAYEFITQSMAEESTNTVADIQRIIGIVNSSVNSLSAASEKILDFVDKDVQRDYDSFTKNSDQYYKDAQVLNQFMLEFSSIAEQLSASIYNITDAINDVTIAVTSGAESVQCIASSTEAAFLWL